MKSTKIKTKNKNKSKTIVTRKHTGGGSRPISILTDTLKFKVLTLYSKGTPIIDIALQLNIFSRDISSFITYHLQSMNSTRETNKLLETSGLNNNRYLPTPEEMSKEFIDTEVPEKCLEYAYYMGMTGDNKYALKASGLSKSIIAKTGGSSGASRTYAIRSRGMYLRSLPSVQKEIDRVRSNELRISDVDKPYLVTEILEQLNQAKELAVDDPTQRRHAVALLRMLGDTIPDAFSHSIKITEVNPEDSLQALIEMAEKDLPTTTSTYTIEDNEVGGEGGEGE